MKPSLLSTRKLEPLLAAAARQNFHLYEEDFIRIEAIATEEKKQEAVQTLNGNTAPLVFTSSNAVTALAGLVPSSLLQHRQVFALSGKTKNTVTQNAVAISITATAKDAASLAHAILQHPIPEVIFFCGDQRRDELPLILRSAGVAVHEVVVYRTVEIPVRFDRQTDGVLFFSPSAVRSFFSVNRLPVPAVCFAIGHTTAECLAQHTSNVIITSHEASADAMLMMVQQYFDPSIIKNDPEE